MVIIKALVMSCFVYGPSSAEAEHVRFSILLNGAISVCACVCYREDREKLLCTVCLTAQSIFHYVQYSCR